MPRLTHTAPPLLAPRVLPLVLAWLVCACASAAPSRGPSPLSAAASDSAPQTGVTAPDSLRLSDEVTPRAYALHLHINPAAPRFLGTVTIDVELARPTRLIRLHALDLTVTNASYLQPASSPLDARLDGRGGLTLSSDKPLPAGRGQLSLTFEGALSEPPFGLYRSREGDHHYAFTQFQPLAARRAFPCFDEPRFKVPFTVTLSAPRDTVALANMPVRASTTDGPVRTTHFATSPPMPTYLVAVAVGPFDLVEGPRLSMGRVPLRVATARGKSHLARHALERTPDYLTFLEDWFGSPYPYPKLDLLAVPDLAASAMENIGLITFREAALLIDPLTAPPQTREVTETLIAHELAHIWFGNLVTPAWWDDVWLNEAFAVWLARKAVGALAPELERVDQRVHQTMWVMASDARPESRAVRERIRSEGDIHAAFDEITAEKGAAILTMLESWVGPETFREGIGAYLRAHKHGVATTAHLLNHLEAAASTRARPDAPRPAARLDGVGPDAPARPGAGELGRALQSFVDQPQVPLLHLDWRCEGERVHLEVSQREWRGHSDPRGQAPEAGRTWSIPVCVRLADPRHQYVHCDLLETPRATWTTSPGFCPTFAHPNELEAGYYRWETRLGPISIARADPVVMAGYLGNLRASFEAGRLELGAWLDRVAPLATLEGTPTALGEVLGALATVTALVPEARSDPRFIKHATRWSARLQAFPRDGRSTRDRQLQPMLTQHFGALGDKAILAEAARVTARLVADLDAGRAPALERADLYLPVRIQALGDAPTHRAARQALWEALVRHSDHPTPVVRQQIISWLGRFHDPELVTRSLALVRDGRLRAQDLRTLGRALSHSRPVSEAVWTWLKVHFSALAERLDKTTGAWLPWLVAGLCGEEHAVELEAWFDSHGDHPSGLARNVSHVAHTIQTCAASRARFAAQARAWYAR